VRFVILVGVLLTCFATGAGAQQSTYYELQKGDFPHDVAASPTGEVWYAGQRAGIAGRLEPRTGHIDRIPLGKDAAPQGVIVRPDGAPWFTDGGRNGIVRVHPRTKEIKFWPLPPERKGAELNTAAFDRLGRIWFTGQAGINGRLNPTSGEMKVWDSPKGAGPYGMTTTPKGDIWFVSFAGSYLANVDLETGAATVFEPPTRESGTRRCGRIREEGCG
jgi:virginiamycin B lyase